MSRTVAILFTIEHIACILAPNISRNESKLIVPHQIAFRLLGMFERQI